MKNFRLTLPLLPLCAPVAAAVASPPAPPSPSPVVIASKGATNAEVEAAKRLLDDYYREGGYGASKASPDLFKSCLAEDSANLSCVRERLRDWRKTAREVTIAVLVARTRDGELQMTCLGGSPDGAWLDAEKQQVVSPSDSPSGADQLTDAERCVGKAYGEYMIP